LEDCEQDQLISMVATDLQLETTWEKEEQITLFAFMATNFEFWLISVNLNQAQRTILKQIQFFSLTSKSR